MHNEKQNQAGDVIIKGKKNIEKTENQIGEYIDYEEVNENKK